MGVEESAGEREPTLEPNLPNGERASERLVIRPSVRPPFLDGWAMHGHYSCLFVGYEVK